ncbi:MAG: hypothetical protein WCP39_01005 [Chlamydiota bacterium]
MGCLVEKVLAFNERFQADAACNIATHNRKWTLLQQDEIPSLYKKTARLTYIMIPILFCAMAASAGSSIGAASINKDMHPKIKALLDAGANGVFSLCKESGSSVLEGMKAPVQGGLNLRQTDRDLIAQKRNREMESLKELQVTLDKAVQSEERQATV